MDVEANVEAVSWGLKVLHLQLAANSFLKKKKKKQETERLICVLSANLKWKAWTILPGIAESFRNFGKVLGSG